MKLLYLLIIISNMGLSQAAPCFYLKGYINPVSKQVNNSFNHSVFLIDNNLVNVNFINSNAFPEIGVNFGLEKVNNLFELGFNYYQYKYSFITTTRFPFKTESSFKRQIFANTIGVRFNYGRKLKWNTSFHILAELSIPIKTNYIYPDIDVTSKYLSTKSIVHRTESTSTNGKDVFIQSEFYFNTNFSHGLYLNYGMKFHPLDPYLLYNQNIEITDAMGETTTVLDMRLGHEQIFFFVGLGIKLDFD